MQLYTAESARRRQLLPRTVGFWLDYWTFLHAEDTHPLWSRHPFGLELLTEFCQLVSNTEPSQRKLLKAMVRATAHELTAYRRLADFFPNQPPTVDPLCSIPGGLSISPEWLRWVDAQACHGATLRESLADGVATAVVNGDLATVAFYSRRLASELSAAPWSPFEIRRVALDLFLSREGGVTLADFDGLLRAAVTMPLSSMYLVQFAVSPVHISNKTLKALGATRERLLLAPRQSGDTSSEGRGKVIVGIQYNVAASDAPSALALAEIRMTRLLEMLRTRWYIRAQITGTARVSADATEYVDLGLSQPFWSRHGRPRQPPTLPTNFITTLSRIQQLMLDDPPVSGIDRTAPTRWEATRWHISRTIATWAEDRHAAASHVWQAIESFCGSSSWKPLVDRYLRALPSTLVDEVAADFSRQRHHNLEAGIEIDWYSWDFRSPSRAWLYQVTNRNDTRYWKTWNATPPALYFDSNVGLANLLARAQLHPQNWMKDRLSLSLEHLYAIRNAAVHSGMQLGGSDWAEHTGHLGLELLFALIHEEVVDQRQVIAKNDHPDHRDDHVIAACVECGTLAKMNHPHHDDRLKAACDRCNPRREASRPRLR